MTAVTCSAHGSTLGGPTKYTRKKEVHFGTPIFSKSFIVMFTILNFMIRNAQASEPDVLKIAHGVGYRE